MGGSIDRGATKRAGGFSRDSTVTEFWGGGGDGKVAGVESFGVRLRNNEVSVRLTGPRIGRASEKMDW